MFSPSEREEILENIVNFLKTQKVEIIALVGSNGNGTADEYSDLDLSVATTKTNLKICFDGCVNLIKSFDTFRYFETIYNDESLLVGGFLNSGLEIDIGICTVEEFNKNRIKRAKSKIKIIYGDKSLESVDRKNEQKNKNNCYLIETAWYNIKNAMVALKRGRLFRAIKEIEELRNDIVCFYGCVNDIESKHFREVDNLDENFKLDLAKSYCKDISYEGVKNSLFNTLDLLYFVLDSSGNDKDRQDYQNLFERLAKDINL